VLSAAKPLNIPIPQKDPGYLEIGRVSFEGELLIGAGLLPFVLGLLCIVLGRFGVANVPRSSYARGTAFWAAAFTFLGLAGLVTLGLFVGGQVLTGSAPNWAPGKD